MSPQKNLSKYSKEELLLQELKLKRYQKGAFFVCALVTGSVLLNIYLKKNSGVWICFLLLGIIVVVANLGSDLKKIQDEIKSRNDSQIDPKSLQN